MPNDHHRKTNTLRGKKRENFLKKHNYKCIACDLVIKNKSNLHIDHIIPLDKGGSVKENNLQLLCKSCNLDKGNKPDNKFKENSPKKVIYCSDCGKNLENKLGNWTNRVKLKPGDEELICNSCGIYDYIKRYGLTCSKCKKKFERKWDFVLVRDKRYKPFSKKGIKKIVCLSCSDQHDLGVNSLGKFV